MRDSRSCLLAFWRLSCNPDRRLHLGMPAPPLQHSAVGEGFLALLQAKVLSPVSPASQNERAEPTGLHSIGEYDIFRIDGVVAPVGQPLEVANITMPKCGELFDCAHGWL